MRDILREIEVNGFTFNEYDSIIKPIKKRDWILENARKTTSPRGIENVYFIKNEDLVYILCRWIGGRCDVLGRFSNEKEAESSLFALLEESAESESDDRFFYCLREAAENIANSIFEADDEFIESIILDVLSSQKTKRYAAAIRRALAALGIKTPSSQEIVDFIRSKNESKARSIEDSKRLKKENQKISMQLIEPILSEIIPVTGGVEFRGVFFRASIDSEGSIRIDRAINDAARDAGVIGQGVGWFYSRAQKVFSKKLS